MENLTCVQGRWSIGLCACGKNTVHFHYGNATLHILVEDVRDLGIALQKIAEQLEPQSGEDGSGAERKDLIQ
jgi:hypothetical protein